MKLVKKKSVTSNNKKAKKNSKTKPVKPVVEKLEDVKELVELLQIHQIELEHQNQELRITQAELEVSRNKYVNLFDFSPISYFSMDSEGIIKEVNLSAGKMLGLDRSKLIGKKFMSFVTFENKDIFNSFIKNVFNSIVKHSCELNLFNKDKQIFRVLLEGLEFDNTPESSQMCQVAVIDLTEYKKIEASLNETTEKLKLLNDTKDKFFSIIAHDLRSPFQVFLSLTKTLAEDADSYTLKELSEAGESMYQTASNLFNLLKNLLEWAQIQKGSMSFQPEIFSISDLIFENVQILKKRGEQKGISIINNVSGTLQVYADEKMTNSILLNLLSNAVKFTKKDGVVTICAKELDNQMVEISVSDTGIGMEKSLVNKLFKVGEKVRTLGTDGELSTGLGLLLCKEFVEKQDGRISVESEEGKGSTLRFTLMTNHQIEN